MLARILVAVDGSDASDRAVKMAGALANGFDASLYLLHVVREMQVPDELRKLAKVENLDSSRLGVLKMLGKEILEHAKEEVKKAGAKQVESNVHVGEPATTILRFADENQADLIVMGSRGLGQIEGMLLGSVSRKVGNLAKVDCLTVR